MADNELNLKITGTDQLSPVFAQALDSIASNTARTNEILGQFGASLENAGNKAQGSGEKAQGLNASLLNLSSAVQLVKAGYELVSAAIEKVSDLFGKSIDEAVEAEKAQIKLSGALVATGNYTKQNVKALSDYIDEVEKATGVSGEWVQETIAVGVQMGLSVEKSKELEKAARQLAAATGKDLNEALSLLQGSLAGQSRGLAKVFPQVKELTEGQLKQGDAIKIVTELTNEQYKLYEGSYSASLQKAKNSLSNVYEAIGNIIIQNPLVKKGLDLFTASAELLKDKIEVLAQWVQKNQQVIESLATAFIQVLQLAVQPFIIAFQALSAVWEAAPGLITAIGAALAIATGPIGIAVTAVGALTYAFAKWPGLFDMISGVYKQMVGFIINGISVLGSGIASLVGVFNEGLGNSVKNAMKGLEDYSLQLAYSGQQQQAYGESINETKDLTFKSVEATKQQTLAYKDNLGVQSDKIAANKEEAKSYADIMLGTAATRAAMEKEVQDRDQDLKRFEDYLNNKMRLAVSKKQEEREQLLKFQSEQTTGGGAVDKSTDANFAIAQEETKQKGLSVAVQKGALTRAQYEEELFASEQRIWQQKIVVANAASQELADALGESPAGLQAKLALKQSIMDQELEMQVAHLERIGATTAQIESLKNSQRYQKEQERLALQKQLNELEINQATEKQIRLAEVLGNTPEAMQARLAAEQEEYLLRNQQRIQQEQELNVSDEARRAATEQAELEHKNRMTDIQAKYWEDQASAQEKAGNDWEGFLGRMKAAQIREGAVMGTLHAVQNSQMFKGTQDMLTNLSSLRSSHSKKAFDVGKAAAIAQATVNTFMAATAAFSAMAGIPFVGPALGAAAAAAAVAAGVVNIQKISAQKFEGGGQADEGMDSIPQSLAGKSFILSQGERVVQPEANRQLTDFLNREKTGNVASGGPQYNITLHYNGAGSRADASQMADILIDEIRKRSERGTPIISSKGVTS